MAVVQVDSKIPTCEQGVDMVTLRIDVAAGADSSTAFVFDRAFQAKPMIVGIVRDDDVAIDVACTPSIASLTTTGGTLRQKGTSTVIMTYNITVIGSYINPTTYLRT